MTSTAFMWRSLRKRRMFEPMSVLRCWLIRSLMIFTSKKYKITREEKILMAIQEVIKYEGEKSVLIYKHPAEDFNTMSQLIVHESQEAVFFSDGQALDSFRAGRYTLETKNIPLISKLRNLVSGGVSPFHTEVKHVLKTELRTMV